MTDLADITTLLSACAASSEAFWRLLELDAVRRSSGHFRPPVLEIGCGDGVFARLTGIPIQVGTDREPRALARASALGAYDRVLRLDLHDLDAATMGRYGTIFANSVLEHVGRLELALPRLRAALVPDGRLIATVPLEEMNGHLAFRHGRYVRWRQRQLQHRNLWSKQGWERALLAAGFSDVYWTDYLYGTACRRWDRADVLATLGIGRYRLASVAHEAERRLIPRPARDRAKRALARRLADAAAAPASGPPCAALLCAAR